VYIILNAADGLCLPPEKIISRDAGGGVGAACVVAERFFIFRTHQRRSRCLARGSDINDDGDNGEDDYGDYYNSTTTPTLLLLRLRRWRLVLYNIHCAACGFDVFASLIIVADPGVTETRA